jgi:hypothetical protein
MIKKGPKIIESDDEFLKYIKPGLDKYLICNKILNYIKAQVLLQNSFQIHFLIMYMI